MTDSATAIRQAPVWADPGAGCRVILLPWIVPAELAERMGGYVRPSRNGTLLAIGDDTLAGLVVEALAGGLGDVAYEVVRRLATREEWAEAELVVGALEAQRVAR